MSVLYNLQIQCNPSQITNSIFTELDFSFLICMENIKDIE